MRIGDSVKIIKNGERFWVTLKSMKPGKCVGIVDNNLVEANHAFGDIIEFRPDGIIDVWEEK